MKELSVKKITKMFPEVSIFGISRATIFNGELHTVSDYDLPSDLVKKIEIAFNASSIQM